VQQARAANAMVAAWSPWSSGLVAMQAMGRFPLRNIYAMYNIAINIY
jgi:hypothetical protein